MIDPAVIDGFIAIVGKGNALTARDDLSRYTHENRNIYVGKSPLVLKPANTLEVATIVRLANETRTALVPQGGHTGHVAGAVPDESNTQIVVSLERLNTIREVDTVSNTMTVEAGVVLQTIQEEAARHDRLFPLSLGSQGSCQIGGNISTNAGGTGVLAHGNTRDLVLGLEAVLPNGEIWNGLRKLKKDNTGYSLRNLLVGAEGTLGIVTAAVVKLLAMPRGQQVVWAGLRSPEDALALFSRAQARAGNAMTGFELMHRTPLDFVLAFMRQARNPLAEAHEWHVLAEFSSGRSQPDAEEMAEAVFAEALELDLVQDAVPSSSVTQRKALWQLRDWMGPAQVPQGASIKHDISVPVHKVPEFLELADAIIAAELPGARVCAFGHMGDGNIHYNISRPLEGEAEPFLARRVDINARVHSLVLSLGGSISAEHGIGRLKREMLAATKDPAELAAMRAIKAALDPNGIMNPGKVI